jgi:AmiR/NasT family two-component response regulator
MTAPRHVLLFGMTASFSESLAQLTAWRFTIAPPTNLLETFRTGMPDAVLLSDADFHVHAPALSGIRQTPIVCIGPDSIDAARDVCDKGACGWLNDQASPTAIAMQIELAIRWSEKLQSLANEKQLLAQMLETRKLVERAKAIFMRRLNLDEPTAHKRLQQESQNRRIALAELARRIIESDEMLMGEATPAETAPAMPMSRN